MEENRPDFSKILELARLAEGKGFGSLWVGDSVFAKPRFELLTTLAAVAVECRTATLGTSVLLPALRQPVVLAHSLATLDHISHGRLLIAVGNSGQSEMYRKEFESCGVPFEGRVARAFETVKAMKLLWTADRASFQGKSFSLNNITLDPKPYTKGGPKILMTPWLPISDASIDKIASVSDGWRPSLLSPEEFKRTWEKIRARSKGRDLLPALYITVNINLDELKAKKETLDYLTKYQASPQQLSKWYFLGAPEEIVRKINAYFEAGVRVFSMRFSSYEQENQISIFAEKVLPNLSR